MNAKMVHPISQLHIEGNPNRLGLAVVAYLLPVVSVSINLPKFPKATTRNTEMSTDAHRGRRFEPVKLARAARLMIGSIRALVISRPSYCERSELLICQVHQSELGYIKLHTPYRYKVHPKLYSDWSMCTGFL